MNTPIRFTTITFTLLVGGLAACAPAADAPRLLTNTPVPAWLYATAIPATPAPVDMPPDVALGAYQTELARNQMAVATLSAAGTATKAMQTATKLAFHDGETATWSALLAINQQAEWTRAADATLAQATVARQDTQAVEWQTATAAAQAAAATQVAAVQANADRQRRIESDLQRPWLVLAALGLLGLGVLAYFLYTAHLKHERESTRQAAQNTRVIRREQEIVLAMPVYQHGKPAMLVERLQVSGASLTPDGLTVTDEFDDEDDLTDANVIRYAAKGANTVWQRDIDGQIQLRDPEQEAKRKKVLAFLRKAMQVVGQNSSRVPTRDEMGMHPETWGEPVGLLKPYVCTTVGRNGGTYCTADYPTLRELYMAVGDRQLRLGTVSGVGESPPWPKPAAEKPALSPTLN